MTDVPVCKILERLPEALRLPAADLYFEAFRQKLEPCLGQTEGVGLLAHTFHSDRVLVAVRDGQLVGLAGLQYGGRGFLGLSFADLWRTYGGFAALKKALLLSLLQRAEDPDSLLLDGLVVRSDVRGQGIGTRLLEAVGARAQQLGRSAVELDVVDTNPRARLLYERVGFKPGRGPRLPWLRRVMGFAAATPMTKNVAALQL